MSRFSSCPASKLQGDGEATAQGMLGKRFTGGGKLDKGHDGCEPGCKYTGDEDRRATVKSGRARRRRKQWAEVVWWTSVKQRGWTIGMIGLVGDLGRRGDAISGGAGAREHFQEKVGSQSWNNGEKALFIAVGEASGGSLRGEPLRGARRSIFGEDEGEDAFDLLDVGAEGEYWACGLGILGAEHAGVDGARREDVGGASGLVGAERVSDGIACVCQPRKEPGESVESGEGSMSRFSSCPASKLQGDGEATAQGMLGKRSTGGGKLDKGHE